VPASGDNEDDCGEHDVSTQIKKESPDGKNKVPSVPKHSAHEAWKQKKVKLSLCLTN
jgi:hypothetical protein